MHENYSKTCRCIVSMLCVAMASVAAMHNGTSGSQTTTLFDPHPDMNAEAGGR